MKKSNCRYNISDPGLAALGQRAVRAAKACQLRRVLLEEAAHLTRQLAAASADGDAALMDELVRKMEALVGGGGSSTAPTNAPPQNDENIQCLEDFGETSRLRVRIRRYV